MTHLFFRSAAPLLGLLMMVFSSLAQSQGAAGSFVVTLTNPLDLERADEPILWGRAELEKKLGAIPAGKFIQVSGENERPVAVQFDDRDGDGQWDEVFFVRSFGAKERIRLQIAVAEGPAAVKVVVRAHVRMRAKNGDGSFGSLLDSAVMPVRNPPTDFSVNRLPPWLTEGPAWENDKVAYRLYFDTRNDKDIYGKTTTAMVMDEVGVNPDKSYHELADWGMDILKVGGSLGAGALAISVPVPGRKDTLMRLGGLHVRREAFRKVADGPFRAIFRMDYEWEINDHPVTVSEETAIAAGQYYYESKVTVSGAPAGSRLVTGIANFYTNAPGNFRKDAAAVLYSYGRQSENKDLLGMGILVRKRDFSTFSSRPASGSDVTSTYTVSQRIPKDRPVYFRFYTGWERTDPGFASAEYFTDMLKGEAAKFSHPIQVKW